MKLVLITAVLALFEVSATAAPTPETLYDEGQAAYDHADYATAIAKWNESYKLSNEPELLFNLAQAYRLNGDCKQALSIYRRFILIDPTPDQHPLVNELTRELETQCDTLIQTPSANRPGGGVRLAGVVTGGAGVILFATGIALGHHASTLGSEVTSACTVSCDWSAQKSKDEIGRRDATIGYAFDALGVAAIASGAILYYLGDRESGIRVAPRESGAIVSWSKSW